MRIGNKQKNSHSFRIIAGVAVMMLAAANAAIFIEAGNGGHGMISEAAIATSDDNSGHRAVSGPATNIASVVTVGAGVVVGAGAAIWLVNFFRKLSGSEPSTAARSATHATKQDIEAVKSGFKTSAKKAKKTARVAGSSARNVARTASRATKSAARTSVRATEKAARTTNRAVKTAASRVKKSMK